MSQEKSRMSTRANSIINSKSFLLITIAIQEILNFACPIRPRALTNIHR